MCLHRILIPAVEVRAVRAEHSCAFTWALSLFQPDAACMCEDFSPLHAGHACALMPWEQLWLVSFGAQQRCASMQTERELKSSISIDFTFS